MKNEDFFTAPEGIDADFVKNYVDKETVDEFAGVCEALNMTQEQAAGVWAFIVKGLAALLEENKEDDTKICRDISKLFGERFGKNSEQKRQDLIVLINRFGGDDFIRLMKETGIGYRLEMLTFLMNLIADAEEDRALSGEKDGCGENGETLKAQIAALMKNPAYVEKMHPEHDACVRRVYGLRKKMFNED